jgi:hypothetical protein
MIGEMIDINDIYHPGRGSQADIDLRVDDRKRTATPGLRWLAGRVIRGERWACPIRIGVFDL